MQEEEEVQNSKSVKTRDSTIGLCKSNVHVQLKLDNGIVGDYTHSPVHFFDYFLVWASLFNDWYLRRNTINNPQWKVLATLLYCVA